MVTFNQPLYLIVALCLVLGFPIVSAVIRRWQNNSISNFGKRETLDRFSKLTAKKVANGLAMTLSLVALALAAAEPMLKSGENAATQTLNGFIVMDISRSMLAEDGPAGRSRLEAGIQAVETLFAAYPDGRFGLAVYTNQAFVYPPTFDHEALLVILRDISENYLVRGEGSNPLAALSAVANLTKDLPYTANTVFLITDGGKSLTVDATQPPASPVMKQLRDAGIHLITVGVGTPLPVPIPVYAGDGTLTGYHQYQGMTAYTALDETLLRDYAAETGGSYHQLTGPDDLVNIASAENLDRQSVAAKTSVSLVWLPVVASILLTTFWLNPRPA